MAWEKVKRRGAGPHGGQFAVRFAIWKGKDKRDRIGVSLSVSIAEMLGGPGSRVEVLVDKDQYKIALRPAQTGGWILGQTNRSANCHFSFSTEGIKPSQFCGEGGRNIQEEEIDIEDGMIVVPMVARVEAMPIPSLHRPKLNGSRRTVSGQ